MKYLRKDISVGFSEGTFPSGTHVCYIFGEHEERMQVLSRFFEAGRSAGEKLLYIVDNDQPEAMTARLESYGLQPRKEAQMEVVRSKEIYFPQGTFCDEAV